MIFFLRKELLLDKESIEQKFGCSIFFGSTLLAGYSFCDDITEINIKKPVAIINSIKRINVFTLTLIWIIYYYQ